MNCKRLQIDKNTSAFLCFSLY